MAKEIVQKFEFGLDAGTTAIGAHKLGVLPAGATITQAWIDVDTTFVDADDDSATIALGYTGAAGAFDAAIAISDVSNPWDAAVPRVSDAAADGAVGNFVVISSDVDVLCTIADDALTAGKGFLYVKYVLN